MPTSTFSTAGPDRQRRSDPSAVGAYYDVCQWWYRHFYSDAASMGIHYGFWDGPRTTREAAMVAPYRDVVRRLQPVEGQRILDAGCGIGGASLWLTSYTRARYTGITISGVQVETARKLTRRRGLAGRAEFQCLDYRDTGLPTGSFDGAFSIESLCYAYPEPETAFAEIYRLIRPGGRYVMLDGMLTRKPANAREEQMARDFSEGFGMSGWSTRDEILAQMRACGFRRVEFADRTPHIRPSVEDIHRRHRIFRLLRGVERVGVIPGEVIRSLRATGAQKDLYEAELLGYGLFYGEK